MNGARPTLVICGATGFIGRNLVEHFAASGAYRVRAVGHDRPSYELAGVDWVEADLTRPEDAERAVAGADIVVQAAATTSGSKEIVTRPYIHTTDNAVMNSLLLRAAFEHKVRHFVFFSCTVMYQPSDRPVKETDFDANRELVPQYFGSGWTKLYIERMCEFYARISDTRFTVLRHSNVYGPHDKFDLERSHVFGATVTKVMSAPDPGTITVWGTGEEGRDLLYVSDLVDAVERALERQRTGYELLNIGAGSAVAVKDLVAAIVEASGKTLDVEHDLSKPTIPTTLCLDCARARELLGWRPRVALKDGIARTLRWWRDAIGTT